MCSDIARVLRAARSGQQELLKQEIEKEGLVNAKEPKTGLTALHLAAAAGHEQCVEVLLEAQADVLAKNAQGANCLHMACQGAIPMCAYQLASRTPAACLERNDKGQTPIELAAASEKGEVMNAMLLACSGHATAEALQAMRQLLQAGAVCDTWAPNGSSALMLAASVDCAEGVQLLLDNAASLELQDALGRTALMFAAGNNARHALEALLDHGASVSIRDRRGRNVVDYAAADSEVRQVLEARIAEMESKAAKLQEELLAELLDDELGAAAKERPSKKSKKKKQAKSKAVAGKPGAGGSSSAAAADAADAADMQALPAAVDSAAGGSAAEESFMPQEKLAQQAQTQAQAGSSCAGGPMLLEASEAVLAAGTEQQDTDQQSADDLEWQVVVGKAHKQHSGQLHQHHAHHHDSGIGSGRMRRCPSASSLASTCSGESHDTAGSSQRSVLIPPTRCGSAARTQQAAKAALGQTAAAVAGAPGPAKPAWGKSAPTAAAAATPQPPAPDQQQQQQQQRQQPDLDEAAFPPLAAVHQQQQEPHVPITSGTSRTEPGLQQPGEPAPAAAGGAAAAGGSASCAPAEPAPSTEGVPAGLPRAEAQSEAAVLAAEVAALRAEVARLKFQQQQAGALHQEELAAILADAAAHEATAVAEAVTAERMNCIYRFAAFLQNNNLAADLLTSHGLLGAGGCGLHMAGVGAGSPPQSSCLPAGSLDFLGFPPTDARRCAAPAKAPVGRAAAPAGSLLGMTAGNALASAPFSFTDLEQRLRTEYSGDTSHFVVPASEAEATVPLPLSLF